MNIISQFVVLFSFSLAAFAQAPPLDSTEKLYHPDSVNLKMLQFGGCKDSTSQKEILIMGDVMLMAQHFEQGKKNPKVKASIIVLNGNSVEGSYSDLNLTLESKSDNKFRLTGIIQYANPMIGLETSKINLLLSSDPSYATFGGQTLYTCTIGSKN